MKNVLNNVEDINSDNYTIIKIKLEKFIAYNPLINSFLKLRGYV